MSFSDILSLIEILVTILFGYYITHWVSVRDSRTRSVKDLYLEQLDEIKKNVDEFFNNLFDEKLNGRRIADWYGHQQEKLTCFDEGLRMALPIRKRKIEEIINDIHEEITGSDYYNEHFKQNRYTLNKQERARMDLLRAKIDKAFNEYIVQINNSRQYYFWETIKQNYLFDLAFFKTTKCKKPVYEAVKIRVLKSLPYLIFLGVLALVVLGANRSFNNSEEMINKRDSINDAFIERFLERTESLDESLKSISITLEKCIHIDSSMVEIVNEQSNEVHLMRKNGVRLKNY